MKSLPVPVEARRGWPPGFVREAEDRRALVRLTALRGITPRNLHRLAWDVGSARACVAAVRSGRAGSDADRSRIDAVDPGRILGATEAAGGTLVAAGDPGYPAELEDLADPPGWLFVRGRPVESRMLGVAVVGARKASALGREVARELGRRLSGAGITVVSGAASGIDIAAHRGALAAGGPTLAVMGSGIDVPYPRSSADTLEAIAQAGTIVSEYPPGTPAEPHHFPARNRIVAALGRALVVVEGTARSGSRISVDHALDLGPGCVRGSRTRLESVVRDAFGVDPRWRDPDPRGRRPARRPRYRRSTGPHRPGRPLRSATQGPGIHRVSGLARGHSQGGGPFDPRDDLGADRSRAQGAHPLRGRAVRTRPCRARRRQPLSRLALNVPRRILARHGSHWYTGVALDPGGPVRAPPNVDEETM